MQTDNDQFAYKAKNGFKDITKVEDECLLEKSDQQLSELPYSMFQARLLCAVFSLLAILYGLGKILSTIKY